MPLKTDALQDFVTFSTHLSQSQDIDPLYPVLRWLARDLSVERRAWLLVLYLTYYNLASAWFVFNRYPDRGGWDDDCLALPIAHERRNIRGRDRLQKHLHSLLQTFEAGIVPTLQRGFGDNPYTNYDHFWLTIQSVWGNGRWAAFKAAEVFQKVADFPLAAPDMRLKDCPGPIAGLEMLFDFEGANLAQLNAAGTRLRVAVSQQGLRIPDWETLETMLCNWKSLVRGRYYIGHDIDEMQHVILSSVLPTHHQLHLTQARLETLPHDYLGEARGWSGVQKQHLKLYQTQGLIFHR